MSTPASPISAAPLRPRPDSRQSSLQGPASRQQYGIAQPSLTGQPKKTPQYTVFVRLPFPRNGFVDPPPVQWDALKDKALWNTISKASDTRELDWQDIATRLDVSLEFLMQQAAWLYERHFAGVRKQMQRLATTAAPSPTPGSGSADGTSSEQGQLQRAGSKNSRTPSALSNKRTSIVAPAEQSNSPVSPRIAAPPFSRTPSTQTITQSRQQTSALRVGRAQPNVASISKPIPAKSAIQNSQTSQEEAEFSPEPAESQEDDSDSDFEPSMAQSQAFRRQPFGKRPVTLQSLSSDGSEPDHQDDNNDDDDELSGGFLPFARRSKEDPAATLRNTTTRDNTKQQTRNAQRPSMDERISSASSAGSTQPLDSLGSRASQPSQRPDALSPRHRAQLTQLSSPPRSQRDGSDGAPSMGSSFSDLDDAGISASAIEDAVLSQMQAGGGSIASRVSGLSQAFRGHK